ncbi:hypothetical protein SAMN05443248_8855 [Bradyrhizobium erythrophlei]|uniref:Uncharacterized protein n=1 Tax=Bradyrhizobium erythrophlei TaxID=1437360 RepID=A0A1M5YVT1_9BRAD|nr:hypothetical protein SAMN05443248_8855 [Bradyrhizobium erythrophlei]
MLQTQVNQKARMELAERAVAIKLRKEPVIRKDCRRDRP